MRCAYLTNGAVLAGFTLTHGATQSSGDADRQQTGGGVWCESVRGVLTNCVLTGNSACYGGGAYSGTLHYCTLRHNHAVRTGDARNMGRGGGVYNSTLLGCTLMDNIAIMGGGASGGALNNCSLTNNSAGRGGGAHYSTLEGCVLAGNTAGTTSGGGAYGGTLSNCSLTNNSANLEGGGALLAKLDDCVLMGNSAREGGGGASSCTLNNCRLTRNRSNKGGGGVFIGTLNNCVLSANSAQIGGGALDATLNNCTLTGNSVEWEGGGGGASCCTLNNCILYYNSGPLSADNYSTSTLTYCCATPLPPSGLGNITNEPAFVDLSAGDFHLQGNSPCINAGQNAYAASNTDLDGLPRIVGGTIDIGAYEVHGPASAISYAWLQQYNLPTDGSADAADPDADGRDTWQEWRCQTDPTDPFSVLRLLDPLPDGTTPGGVIVRWQSAAGVNYFLERCTGLSPAVPFSVLVTNVFGQPDTTTYTDTNAVDSGLFFYRVGVGD